MSLCPHCHNTGSLSKVLTGQLDCAHCHVAVERIALDDLLKKLAPEAGPARDWVTHQLGRTAALAGIAGLGKAYQ